MLYRLYECFVEDGSEPYTTVWLVANNSQEAQQSAKTLLALAWNIPEERVGLQGMARDEIDCLLEAIEDDAAGDRRLWASGSTGPFPLYHAGPVLIAAPAKQRRRLLDAYRAAQAHALELAARSDAEAEACRVAGNVAGVKSNEYDAKVYREFAAAELI